MPNWEAGAKGAVGGAAVGSALGPWGAAAGGVIGGALGMFGGGGADSVVHDRSMYELPDYQNQYNQYGALAGQYSNRAAPLARQSGYATQQRMFGNQLQNEAQGRGIGQELVRRQAQQASDQAAQQQFAQAAGGPSSMQALGQRNAAMNAGNAQAAVGGQAALAGGQMQLGAMNQYGQFLQGARGADDAMSQFNAGQQLQSRGMNDQAQLEALRQRLAASGQQQQGRTAYEQARTGQSNADNNRADANSWANTLQSGALTYAQLAAMRSGKKTA